MALQGSAEILLLALIKDIKGLERHRAPGMMCSLLTPPEIPLSLSLTLSLVSSLSITFFPLFPSLLLLTRFLSSHVESPSPPFSSSHADSYSHFLPVSSEVRFFSSLIPPYSLFLSISSSLGVCVSFFPSRASSPPLPPSRRPVWLVNLH